MRRMINRRSKALSFFADPGELNPIVEAVLSAAGARLCRAHKREGRWVFQEVQSDDTHTSAVPQFYACLPGMIKEVGLDSLANLVQVWFPKRIGSDLCMGEVGMLIADSELDARLCQLQARIYGELRKELTSRFKRGVWGRNSNTGGEHFYKDILISKDIETATRSGLILRPQLGDGFVTFSPDRAQ